MFHIESFGATDVGRQRQLNEDSLLFDDEFGLYIVADGMGGHNAGEIASKLAVEVTSAFIRRSRESEKLTWPYGVDPQLSYNGNRLRTALMLANKKVWKEADTRDEYTGMGTTLVAALVEDGLLTVSHAGDSRAYRIRRGKLERLTTDDTWVQAAFTIGAINEEQAQNHPMRSVITKAIGAKEDIEPSLTEEPLQDGDVFLLCSDGLHGAVGDPMILELVLKARGNLEKAIAELIAAANAAGGKDNVTVVMFALRSETR